MTDPVQVAGTGKGELKKGGVFFADLPDGISSRTYKISFDRGDNLHYSVRWKNDGGDYTKDPDDEVYGVYLEGGWQCGSDPATHIRTDADCIFKTARCFIFNHFWKDRDNVAKGDEFFFTVNAKCMTLEMPVLFHYVSGIQGGWAVARTINHVNCLVDGDTVFTGHPDYYDPGDVTIFTDYVRKLFVKGGYKYENVIFCYSLPYHDTGGNIHCGTNVRRVVPNTEWWK